MKPFLLFLFFIPSFAPAQNTQLEKFIDSLMAPGNRPGMPGSFLIIAKDGNAIVRKAYGMANLELDVQAKPELALLFKSRCGQAVTETAEDGNDSQHGFGARFLTFEQIFCDSCLCFDKFGDHRLNSFKVSLLRAETNSPDRHRASAG